MLHPAPPNLAQLANTQPLRTWTPAPPPPWVAKHSTCGYQTSGQGDSRFCARDGCLELLYTWGDQCRWGDQGRHHAEAHAAQQPHGRNPKSCTVLATPPTRLLGAEARAQGGHQVGEARKGCMERDGNGEQAGEEAGGTRIGCSHAMREDAYVCERTRCSGMESLQTLTVVEGVSLVGGLRNLRGGSRWGQAGARFARRQRVDKQHRSSARAAAAAILSVLTKHVFQETKMQCHPTLYASATSWTSLEQPMLLACKRRGGNVIGCKSARDRSCAAPTAIGM